MTAMTRETATRTTARSEAELLGAATSRTPMSAVDGLSNVPMERVVLDGERLVVKWLARETDWIMRLSDDHTNRAVVLWETGLYDDISAFVDPAVVGACRDEETGRGAVLMRDLGEHFVPEGATPFTVEQHETFVRAMAALHAGFWGWRDELGLCTDEIRLSFFGDARLDREVAERGELAGVPAYVRPGWDKLAGLAPRTAEVVRALVDDPAPWASALAETPRTFIHTDWKGGNLGVLPAGRTLLVDWAFPGEGAGCTDLAWYLAVNCDRLPASKESTVALYRRELEDLGVLTTGWFERQLDLALVGAFGMLGWSKTEDPEELAWWVDRVTPVAHELTG